MYFQIIFFPNLSLDCYSNICSLQLIHQLECAECKLGYYVNKQMLLENNTRCIAPTYGSNLLLQQKADASPHTGSHQKESSHSRL